MNITRNNTIELLKSPVFIFLAISLIVIGGLIYLAFSLTPKSGQSISDSVIEEGNNQVVNIMAKNGFTPEKVTLKSEKDTVLKVTTKNTIDCSNTFVINELNIRKDLPLTGEVEVRIPPQKPGSKITATCSMGHYNLELSFL